MTKTDEQMADEWLRDNDWDYQKYKDRRGDRSAYDSLMNYEISDEVYRAFLDGLKAGREQMQAGNFYRSWANQGMTMDGVIKSYEQAKKDRGYI